METIPQLDLIAPKMQAAYAKSAIIEGTDSPADSQKFADNLVAVSSSLEKSANNNSNAEENNSNDSPIITPSSLYKANAISEPEIEDDNILEGTELNFITAIFQLVMQYQNNSEITSGEQLQFSVDDLNSKNLNYQYIADQMNKILATQTAQDDLSLTSIQSITAEQLESFMPEIKSAIADQKNQQNTPQMKFFADIMLSNNEIKEMLKQIDPKLLNKADISMAINEPIDEKPASITEALINQKDKQIEQVALMQNSKSTEGQNTQNTNQAQNITELGKKLPADGKKGDDANSSSDKSAEIIANNGSDTKNIDLPQKFEIKPAIANNRPEQPTKTHHHVTIDQISLKITESIKDGDSKIILRLNPEMLGSIEVKMEIDANNNAKLHLVADKQDVVDMLHRDSKELSRSLMDIGFKMDNSSMSFNLKNGDSNTSQTPFFAANEFSGNENGKNGTLFASSSNENEQEINNDQTNTKLYNISYTTQDSLNILV